MQCHQSFCCFFVLLNSNNLLVKFNSLVESGCHRLLLRVIHAEKSAKKSAQQINDKQHVYNAIKIANILNQFATLLHCDMSLYMAFVQSSKEMGTARCTARAQKSKHAEPENLWQPSLPDYLATLHGLRKS